VEGSVERERLCGQEEGQTDNYGMDFTTHGSNFNNFIFDFSDDLTFKSN
jgi:hypothetical protein